MYPPSFVRWLVVAWLRLCSTKTPSPSPCPSSPSNLLHPLLILVVVVATTTETRESERVLSRRDFALSGNAIKYNVAFTVATGGLAGLCSALSARGTEPGRCTAGSNNYGEQRGGANARRNCWEGGFFLFVGIERAFASRERTPPRPQ